MKRTVLICEYEQNDEERNQSNHRSVLLSIHQASRGGAVYQLTCDNCVWFSFKQSPVMDWQSRKPQYELKK